MEKIALAKKIEYKPGDEQGRGRISIEPLFPGYGTTLGNSLRRVLLSSLLGAAPVGVKIEGVGHEFMTLPHLKEDILEFILNLKKIRLKIFSDESVKLTLKVHGEKTIKASDIEKNSAVEITNPELVLGHITDMAGSLSAEIMVSKGMGYEMIEGRGSKISEIGYIEMDSIFSPVLAAGVSVENVRVGKMTNWDKLVIDIKTDGTISPEEAFKYSVNILVNQFNALVNPPAENKDKEKEAELEKMDNSSEISEEKEAGKKSEDDQDELRKVDTEEEPVKKKRGRPKKS